MFNDSERAAVVSFWNQPGRYSCVYLNDPKGSWVVRLTAEGSQWLWRYNKARGLSKTNPLVDAGPITSDQADWENWIDAKVAFDRQRASLRAAESNGKKRDEDSPNIDPLVDPGPMPQGLLDLAGDAPRFAESVKPFTYTVTFEDGANCHYRDQVDVRPRYAYFRFPHGITTSGSKLEGLPPDEVTRLCKLAGLSETEHKVMAAVSPLEGGFDSVNTYDTGFVSVGFIQFACLQAGAGSLGAVLNREKATQPGTYATDFRRYGIDVQLNGKLVCVDPTTGMELEGPEAAQKIIDDKRLTAVFQRAGQRSDAFRVAQLQVARDMYYPTNDTVPIATELGTVRCKVSDFVRSEAGLAVLMDRKVNTGNLGPLTSVVSEVIQSTGAQTIDDLSAHEMEIVEALIYRKDFLADPTLSQPAGTHIVGSRHGDPKRKGTRTQR